MLLAVFDFFWPNKVAAPLTCSLEVPLSGLPKLNDFKGLMHMYSYTACLMVYTEVVLELPQASLSWYLQQLHNS